MISSYSERDEILNILKRNKIDSLWHFTDVKNLPLIRKLDGLRSKNFHEDDHEKKLYIIVELMQLDSNGGTLR